MIDTDFPIITDVYLHRDKDTGYMQAESLGLDEEQSKMFAYAGYEVKITVKVNQNGKAYATHLNDVKLEKAVQI